MLPEPFLKRMQAMLMEEYPAFLQSFEEENCHALRVNTRKADIGTFLEKSPFLLQKVPWADNGFYYGKEDQPGKHPYHEAGVYYIQEPSAMAPVPFLEVKPGERVLDLCAAPGGKTTQIADCMQGKGILVSNEIHPARARILSENVERMGVCNAVVTNESPEKLAAVFPAYFDKILVDAPCSGEGMFRKNDAACAEWSEENVALCAKRQDEVLRCAGGMLRPGGRLVYATCTFAPKEDEGTVSRFINSHPDFCIVKIKKPDGFANGQGKWIEEPASGIEEAVRLLPHKIRGEGHFFAVLERKGSEASVGQCSRLGVEKGLPETEYREFLEFKEQYLAGFAKEGIYLKFGEQLYLAPPDIPALKGLKVLRPGLHLGTFKKNRFEPSHALALALSPKDVSQCMYLNAKESEVRQYLCGQILPTEGTVFSEQADCVPKGWCLVCVDDYSLGWGKAAGGIVKNHYPKGLRVQVWR